MNIHELEQLDQQLTLTINSWHSAFTDPIMWFFSDKKVWIPMYAAIIALMFWKMGWKKTLILLATVVLTIVFCDQFANLIKNWAQRIRPVNDQSMVERGLHILEWGGGYSFFSAHAANAFGVACCTFPVLRKFAGPGWSINRPETASTDTKKPDAWARFYIAWILVWAFMVSISRIFVGKHFLGDVIVGIVVGITFGLIMSAIAIYAIRKLKV